jgi:hypothetical protein
MFQPLVAIFREEFNIEKHNIGQLCLGCAVVKLKNMV